MKKLFALFTFTLLIFSFASIGFLNAQENDSDNSGSGSDGTVEVEIEIESDNSGSSNDDSEDSENSDGETEIEEETEVEEKDGETRIKSRTEIRTADGLRIREEFELRERTELTDQQKRRIFQARNKLKINGEVPENCERTGSVLKCEINGTRILTIHAGNSNNTIIQIKDYNASTRVELYKDGEEVYGVFRNNETKRIILPDEARERIKLNARLHNETFNLTEEGRYEIEARKEARLLFLIKVKEEFRADIDAETGEVIRTRGPWWGFLAKDIRAESETDVNSGTFLEGEVPEGLTDEELAAA